jgi:peptide/nickel transport system substrate-binding protein
MPVGTGPFKVVEYNLDENLILEANANYWGGEPKLARIEYRFIAEDATRVAEMQAGRADIVQGVPVSLASTIEDLPDAHIEPVGSPTVNVLRFNFCAAPTDDVRVRKAISHAIDRDGIIAAILQGYGNPINSFQSELSLGNDPSIENYAYDPEMAKKLLSEAGVAAGTPLQIDFVGTDQISREIVQAVAAMLDAVGFKTSLQSHEANTYFNDVVPQNTVGSLYTFGWGGWTLDFDNTAYLLFMPEQFWNPCFSDDEIASLLEQQRQTYDQTERESILQAVARREHELIIDVPLYQSVNLWGVADRVKDFVAPADDRHQFLNVSVTE